MPIYHLFSKGYYIASVEKEEGLQLIQYPPATDVAEFNEFDNPKPPEPGSDWVAYRVEPLRLSNGEQVLIAVHEKAPDEYTIESMINRHG